MGNQTLEIHDTLGRVATIERKNSFGITTALQENYFDPNGNKIEVRNVIVGTPQTLITKWEYNSAGQVTHLTEAVGTPQQKHTAIHFNDLGEKETIIKPDGNRIIHEYDSLGRVIHLHSTDQTIDYEYTYNHNQQLLQVDDLILNQTTHRTYDSQECLTSETLGNQLTLNYTYDTQDRLVKMTLPDHSEVHYAYDPTNLVGVKRDDLVFSYAYDLAGNVENIQYPCEKGDISYQGDSLGRTTTISHPYYSEKDISYDAAGNLTHFEKSQSETSTPCDYAYDDLYQLCQEKKEKVPITILTILCIIERQKMKQPIH